MQPLKISIGPFGNQQALQVQAGEKLAYWGLYRSFRALGNDAKKLQTMFRALGFVVEVDLTHNVPSEDDFAPRFASTDYRD